MNGLITARFRWLGTPLNFPFVPCRASVETILPLFMNGLITARFRWLGTRLNFPFVQCRASVETIFNIAIVYEWINNGQV